MHPPPVLRVARHADMHAIGRLDADVFGEEVYPAFFFRQAMDLWPELLLVAELDGRLLGYALGGVGQDRSQGWLLSLAVRPEARGFGLAERMMLRVEQGLTNQGIDRVRLTVNPANPARRLYFRLGYALLGEEPGYFGQGEDRLLLEKVLA